jgi:malonyl-CoA/methylmalonyl-CoA synthetase
VQVEKSVEALLLYLATLRAGYVFLPLNTAYQSAEIEYFIGNAEPAVVVCSAATLAGSARSPSRPARARVHAGRRPHGSLLERAAPMQRRSARAGCQGGRRPGRHPLHQRHHRAQQGRDADARQPAEQRAVLKDYWGWQP